VGRGRQSGPRPPDGGIIARSPGVASWAVLDILSANAMRRAATWRARGVTSAHGQPSAAVLIDLRTRAGDPGPGVSDSVTTRGTGRAGD
jgi:hypothetical protein